MANKNQCTDTIEIKAVYTVKISDMVFENGKFVRMKRKYGKFARKPDRIQ